MGIDDVKIRFDFDQDSIKAEISDLIQNKYFGQETSPELFRDLKNDALDICIKHLKVEIV